jgi:hypothetical protein
MKSSSDNYDSNPLPAELSNVQMRGGYGDSELAKPDLDADLIPDPQPTP